MFLKVFSILNNKFKLHFAVLIFLFFIVGFIEILSIGSIPIYIMFFTNQKEVISYVPDFFGQFFNNFSFQENILVSSIILIFIFFIKNIVIFSINLFTIQFQQSLRSYISEKLYNYYLKNNYEFITSLSTSTLVRNIVEDTQITALYFSQFANLITELIVVSCLLTLLIFNSDIKILLILLILIVALFLIYLTLRKKLELKGVESLKFRDQLIKICNYTFRGFRDIIIFNQHDYVNEEFQKYLSGEISVSTYQKKINLFPRIILELITVSGIVIIIYQLSLSSNNNILVMIPTLSLYFAAIIRMVPSFNKISTSLNKIRYDKPVILNIVKIFNNEKKINKFVTNDKITNDINFSTLEFKNIFFKYQNQINFVLSNLSIKFEKNKSYLIFGKSGVGKTTLLDLIIGLLEINKGSVLVDGKEYTNLNILKNKIGYVAQDPFLFASDVRSNIAFGEKSNDINDKKIEEVLNDVNLLDYFKKEKDYLNVQIGENGIRLSGGQKQRLVIARALYKNSEIIVLDEPTSSLDSENEEEIVKTIVKLKLNKIIIAVSHKDTLKKYFDEIITL